MAKPEDKVDWKWENWQTITASKEWSDMSRADRFSLSANAFDKKILPFIREAKPDAEFTDDQIWDAWITSNIDTFVAPVTSENEGFETTGTPNPSNTEKITGTIDRIHDHIVNSKDMPGFSKLYNMYTDKVGGIATGIVTKDDGSKLFAKTTEDLNELRTPVHNIGNLVRNLVLGGTEAALGIPAFFAQAIGDPVGLTAELTKWGVETSDATVGAVAYVGMRAMGQTDKTIPAELRDNWEKVSKNPVEPLMIFLMATGAVRGAGKLAGESPKNLVRKAGQDRLDPKNLEIAQSAELLGGQKQKFSHSKTAGKLAEIDTNVQRLVDTGELPPQKYSSGVIERSLERKGYTPERISEILDWYEKTKDLSPDGKKHFNEVELMKEESGADAARGPKTAVNKTNADLGEFREWSEQSRFDRTKTTLSKLSRQAKRLFLDKAGNVRHELGKLGIAGSEAVMHYDLSKGSSARATELFEKSWRDVKNHLKIGDTKDLANMLESKRVVEIDMINAAGRKKIQNEITNLEMRVAENLGLKQHAKAEKKDIAKQSKPEPTLKGRERQEVQKQINLQQKSAAALDKEIGGLKKEIDAINKEIDAATKDNATKPASLIAKQNKMKEADRTPQKLREMEMEAAEKKATIQRNRAKLTENVDKTQPTSKGRGLGITESSLRKANKDITVEINRLKKDLEKFEDIEHPGGFTGKGHAKKLVDNAFIFGAQKSKRLSDAELTWRKHLKANTIDEMKKEGLLSESMYNELVKQINYVPRKFLEHEFFDPTIDISTIRNKTKNVHSSGVQKLDKGSTDLLVTNPEYLLWQATNRAQNRIFSNRANNALLDVAVKVPDNGLVEVAKGDKPPTGKTTISSMRNGERQDMWMDNEMAAEWLGIDPVIQPWAVPWFQWTFLNKPLKFFATGVNPEFALVNILRDPQHQWLVTNEYSPHLPKFAKEFATDIKEVWSDAWKRKGAHLDYIKEGGGMDFLTDQGRMLSKEATIKHKALGGIKAAEDIFGYLGQTSEILSRLALRNRAIKNGKTPVEATHIARGYMDFTQGGLLTKAADTMVPYLNANIVGTRGVLRSFANDPKMFTYKAGQIGALSLGLYSLAKMYPDFWEGVSDETKERSWIIPLPMTETKQGVKQRYYVTIPKDQGQTAISSLFTSMAERAIEGKMPTTSTLDRVNALMPIGGKAMIPPIANAMFATCMNYDTWREDKVWNELKRGDVEPWAQYVLGKTPEFYIKLGNIGTSVDERGNKVGGISPEALRVGSSKILTTYNVYNDMFNASLNAMLDEATDEDRTKTNDEILRQIPGARRFVKLTGQQGEFKKLERVSRAEFTTRKINNDKVDALNDSENYAESRTWIKDNVDDPLERDRLRKRTRVSKRTKGFPSVWRSAAHKPPKDRAYWLYEKCRDAGDNRNEVMKMARKVPGFLTEETQRAFSRYKNEYTKEVNDE